MCFNKHMLSLKQKVFIVSNFYRNSGDLEVLGSQFQKEFDVEATEKIGETFNKIISTFERTGSVKYPFIFEGLSRKQSSPKKSDKAKTEVVVLVEEESQVLEYNIAELDEAQKDVKEEETDDKEDKPDSSKEEIFFVDVKPEKKYQCKDCGKTFGKSVYYQHIKTHSAVNSFACKDCNKTFKTHRYLKDHEKIHIPAEDRPKYICEICGKNSLSKTNHNKHRLVHSDVRNYNCRFCDKKFTRPHGLKVHERTHTGEKPYSCKYCDRSFGTHLSYQIHTRTHTGERPYSCPHCDKKFIGASARNVHLKKHKGVAYLECEGCRKKFDSEDLYKEHLKLHIDDN